MKAHFEMMAAYNAWANARLYDAAAEMSDEVRKAPAGAFFDSLYGTLSHLLMGDRAWMRRFDGEGPPVTALTDWPYEAFDDLRAAREAMDARISRYVEGLSEAALDEEMTVTLIVLSKTVTTPRHEALSHLFNHQTHHRGQCHHMLTAAGRDAPPLDLFFFRIAA